MNWSIFYNSNNTSKEPIQLIGNNFKPKLSDCRGICTSFRRKPDPGGKFNNLDNQPSLVGR
jgi:hypothetical protein